MPEIREQVRWFVGKMEEQLQANEYKGGWDDSPFEWLVVKLAEETGEVAEAVIKGLSLERLIKECADVANIAMMIADLARKL